MQAAMISGRKVGVSRPTVAFGAKAKQVGGFYWFMSISH